MQGPVENLQEITQIRLSELPKRGAGIRAQGEDKLAFGLKCLHAITAQLAEEGLPKEDLKPLLELKPGSGR